MKSDEIAAASRGNLLWGAAWGMGVALVLLWVGGAWSRRGGGEVGSGAGAGAGGRAEFRDASNAMGQGEPGGPAGGKAARPFQRAERASAAPVSRWETRIRTNGVFEPGRAVRDPDYRRQVRVHTKLRSLLRSPARDTAECKAVVALVERLGLPLAAVPELYHALYECRAVERRRLEAGTPAEAGAVVTVGDFALTDFRRRFETDFKVPPDPVFEALLNLPVTPTVFFGAPGGSVDSGEVLLAE